MRRILLSLVLLLTLLFALPALAGNWGEDWGTMVWGIAAAVPSLEGVGVWLLVISLLGAAAWRLRRRITPAVLMLVLFPLVPLLMAPHYTNWNGFSNGEVADAEVMNENFGAMVSGVNAALTTGPVSVPNTFTNGSTADADEVNENFTALVDGVNTALANRETDCVGAGGTWEVSVCTPAANNGILNVPAGSTIANNYFVGPNSDLSGADLDGADLTNANLEGANLDGADLTTADLSMVASGGITGIPALPTGFTLTNGYLIGPNVNLSDGNLDGANLSGADMSVANLSGTILTNANLDGADLTNADLSMVASGGIAGTPALPADFMLTDGYLIGPNVNLSGAHLNNKTLTNATLTGATLTNAELFNTDLRGADMNGASLAGADLGLANLTDAILTNANLTGASLGYLGNYETTLTGITSGGIIGTPALPTGYIFGNGHIIGPNVNLTSAYLFNLDLTNLTLSGTNLSGANLTASDLTNADLTNTNLTNANLIGAHLNNANLAEAILTNANLGNATYNAYTVFPSGFDPVSEGMLLVP